MELHPRESVILAEDSQAMVDSYQQVLGFKVTQLFPTWRATHFGLSMKIARDQIPIDATLLITGRQAI
jgi:hypothetical protein